MHTCIISSQDIASVYEGLHRIGALGPALADGFSRPAYSDDESRALRYFERLARENGLAARYDGVGNLIIETPGPYKQWIESGSHLDTVPGGGNFDGAAGIVAAFAVLRHARRTKQPLKLGLRLRIWRGEESAAFGLASIGSRAAFGLLPPEALDVSDGSRTLAEAMRAQRAKPEHLRHGKPAIERGERDGIAAHIELHIEQGSVLERAGREIGIVTGIRGSLRSWVMLTGQFDHSGATPMGCGHRRDVNLAMAHMQVRLDELARHQLDDGADLVQTVGVINGHEAMNRRMPSVADNAVSRVSGSGYFSFEMRSCSKAVIDAYAREAFALIRDTAAAFGVGVEIDIFSELPGVAALDAGLQRELTAACDAVGATHTALPSGAWHDAAVLAGVKRGDGSAIPVGMLFVPSRGGISHNAAEFTDNAQLARGASVLATTMLALACKESVPAATHARGD